MRRKETFIRLLVIAGVVGCLAFILASNSIQQTAAADDFDKIVRPYLAENCISCHSTKSQAGGLDLEKYTTAQQVMQDRDKWDTVVGRIHSGEMPPKGLPRPDAIQTKAVLYWLETELAKADRNMAPDPGRVTARRLNRAEYNNTVRDLLGVQFRPADDFPQDDSGYGFDNIGDVLSLSPVLMEKYLAAAEKIARTAVFGVEPMKPSLVELRTPGQKIKTSFKPETEYDQTGLSLPNAFHINYKFPVNAEYSFRAHLNGARPAGSDALKFALWIDGKQIQVRELDPEGGASFSENRQDFSSWTVDFRVKVPAGEHWLAVSVLNLFEGLPARLNGPNPAKKPQPAPPQFKPRPDLSAEINERRKKAFEARLNDQAPVNDVRIGKIDLGGPYEQAKGAAPESLQKLYVCGHLDGKHQPSCGTKIISKLAQRAYRRNVTAEETNQLVGLMKLVQQRGDSFEEGLVQALEAMLVSPHFLFRIEQDRKLTATENFSTLGAYELASRLSYFLWSTMPDDELLQSAASGSLKKPAVLSAQVKRMLLDPKAKSLVENFGGQWLELRKLESVKPDRDKFPQFDDYLRNSMLRETEMFFTNLIREDRRITEFIDGNYSFLNEKLARFYGIPGVSGPDFRRVELARETQRGGIITQASVLTVSSYATRTSPVLRGKWIMENILNSPPPTPPPDVPPLDDSKVGSAMSLRVQLEEHRKNPTCAACHSKMDPLGFGLENFDAVGAWRTKDGNFPIDPSGILPDGRQFNGAQELKGILKANQQAFAEGMTEKLLTYALGRGLERYDKPTVQQIAKKVAASDYRFSSLVMEIVNSLPFQYRRTALSATKTS